LRDRIDLIVEVHPVELTALSRRPKDGVTSAVVRARVEVARARQHARRPGRLNAQLPAALLEESCPLSPEAEARVKQMSRDLKLSGRGFHGVLRVARTIADLDAHERIEERHLLEAGEYRAV
jgi:magnesium chelatase family protein